MKSLTLRQKWILGISLLILAYLFGGLSGPNAGGVFWDLRFPRFLGTFFVGAGLAISGLIFQTLLANPLSDPYVLGVGSAASIGAILVAMIPGLSIWIEEWGGAPMSLGATIGAFSYLHLMMKTQSKWVFSKATLLIFGMLVNLAGASLITLFLSLGSFESVASMSFWMLGDLSRFTLGKVLMIGLTVSTAFIFFMKTHRKLDAFLLGDYSAPNLGVNRSEYLRLGLLMASLMTAILVSMVGMIGFVGLMVPHWVRRVSGPMNHRVWLVRSVLFGGIVLVASDFIARLMAYPVELPAGTLTTLFGVPALGYYYFRSLSNPRGLQ